MIKFKLTPEAAKALERRQGCTPDTIRRTALVTKHAYLTVEDNSGNRFSRLPRGTIYFQFGRLFSVYEAQSIIKKF